MKLQYNYVIPNHELPPGNPLLKLIECKQTEFGVNIKFALVEKPKKGKDKETLPEVGVYKYFVVSTRFGVYTAMGADNKHHASNKATKLWGVHGWDMIRSYCPSEFAKVSPKEFGELAKTLTN